MKHAMSVYAFSRSRDVLTILYMFVDIDTECIAELPSW